MCNSRCDLPLSLTRPIPRKVAVSNSPRGTSWRANGGSPRLFPSHKRSPRSAVRLCKDHRTLRSFFWVIFCVTVALTLPREPGSHMPSLAVCLPLPLCLFVPTPPTCPRTSVTGRHSRGRSGQGVLEARQAGARGWRRRHRQSRPGAAKERLRHVRPGFPGRQSVAAEWFVTDKKDGQAA